MKLTNYMRDAFVRAVMDDVPCVDYEEQIRQAVVKAAVARLPQAARDLWDNEQTRGFLVAETYFIGGVSVADVPGISGHYRRELVGASEEEAEAFAAQFNELVAVRKSQSERNHALKAKVHAVAYSCTTRKALLEKLPEFEKYLPAEEAKASNLPAVANLVADLVAAGWPDGGKKRSVAVEAA